MRIEAAHLGVQAGEQFLLRNVCLDITSDEFVLITGPSGSGKTTLVRCLAGLIPNAYQYRITGKVTVQGHSTVDMALPELATRVALVFQQPECQLFNLYVEEEIAFGPRNLGLSEQQVARRVQRALAAVDIEHLRTRSIPTLSAGEKQRVAIAAVLALEPRMLILDEPTANLDYQAVNHLRQTVGPLHRHWGMGIVVVEHRAEEFRGLASREIELAQGEILHDGPPGPPTTAQPARQAWEQIISTVDSGQWAVDSNNSRLTTDTDHCPLAVMENVSYSFDTTPVVSDLDLVIYPGECLALVGPNGAGKTTVAQLLAGLLRPQKGTVKYQFDGGRVQLGSDIGLVCEQPQQHFLCDTVNEEVWLGPNNLGNGNAAGIEQVLRDLRLGPLKNRGPHTLSRGEQERTAVAAALSLAPRLLILDEPTAGQDAEVLHDLMNLVASSGNRGRGLLLITHHTETVRRWADRVVVMENGHIVAQGPVKSEPQTISSALPRRLRTGATRLDFQETNK